MGMITMQGQLVNTYKANNRTDRDTGVITEGKMKIQVMGHNPMESGDKRLEMHDLTCNDIAAFKPFTGKYIRFELGIMSSENNTILYIPRGAQPVEIKAEEAK
jgi:hypothetical protein